MKKDPELDLGQITRGIGRLIDQAYSDGARDTEIRLRNRQAAIDRNGGTEPDYHNCHFCGEYVANGYNTKNERHWLSDCRPDLVEHESGPTCTWHGLAHADGKPAHEPDCYAFQDRVTRNWTNEHKHFDRDGAM